MADAECDLTPDGLFAVIRIPKALLVLTRPQYLDALRRGKLWKRRAEAERREALDLERRAARNFPPVS